jgi:hypothetical protein
LAAHYLGGRFELAEAAILQLETHELANRTANQAIRSRLF